MAAPQGHDKTIAVTAGSGYTLGAADFGLTGAQASQVAGVVLFPALMRGTLELGGTLQAAEVFVTRAEIEAGALRYSPPAVGGLDQLAFSLLDVDDAVDLTANLLVFEVAAPNTAPRLATGDGMLRLDLPGEGDYARDLAVRSDGVVSVLLTGAQDSDFAFARLLSSGAFDPQFGEGDGPLALGTGSGSSGRDIVVLADGRSLIVEWGTSGTGIEVTRLTAAGRLDLGFAGDGQAEIDVPGVQNERGRALLAQTDGSTVVVFSGGGDVGLLRLDATGALDPAFGVDGVVRGPAGTPLRALQQADGKLLLLNAAGNSLLRLNGDGSVDTAFGSGGQVAAPVGSAGALASATLQDDGKIVLVGWSGEMAPALTVWRYGADGSLDTAFGSSGRFVLQGAEASFANGVTVQPDGRIIVVGFGADGAIVLRLDAQGALDPGFANGGLVLDAGAGDSQGFAVSVAPDGRIVVAGSVSDEAGAAAAVFSLNADGSADAGFAARRFVSGGEPVVVDPDLWLFDAELAARGLRTSTSTYSARSWGSGEHSGQVEVPWLSASGDYAGSTVKLEREGGAAAADVFGGSGALVLANGTATLGGVAIGTYAASDGSLSLTFGSGASGERVLEVLRSITYTNTSAEPPQSVRIAWTISDGAAGGAGALAAIAVSTIHIVAPGGTESADLLVGTAAANRLDGGAGNDLIDGGGGSDIVDGGSGIDTFVLDADLADVLAHPADLAYAPGRIDGLGSSLGAVELAGVERVQLRDGLFAFDTLAPLDDLPGDKVWQVAALYQAAFGQLPGSTALSRWTAQADRASDMGELAQAMIDHYAPGVSSAALVQHLYFMLAGEQPSVEATQDLVDLIGPGKTYETQGELFAHAATLPANTAQLVDFTGSIQVLDPVWFGTGG